MRVASLFAGVGGFDLAFTRLGHEIVYVNEWDKYAAQTYTQKYKQAGNAVTVNVVEEIVKRLKHFS